MHPNPAFSANWATMGLKTPGATTVAFPAIILRNRFDGSDFLFKTPTVCGLGVVLEPCFHDGQHIIPKGDYAWRNGFDWKERSEREGHLQDRLDWVQEEKDCETDFHHEEGGSRCP